MSQENVAIVRAMVGAVYSDDPGRSLSAFHSEIEFTSVFDAGRTYIGLDGMREYAANLDDIWVGWHSEDNRFIDAGEERVVWLYRIVGTGRTSGVAVNQTVAIIWTFRDGLIWRGQAYLDHNEALKVVGLEE